MASAPPSADLGFLFVGGLHQALHMAPVAVALAGRGVAVTAYAPSRDCAGLRGMLAELDPETRVRIVPLALPGWARAVRRVAGGGDKVLALIAHRKRLLAHDALLAAERTSTLLKRLPGRRPVMIHLPHGSGDRAVGFEPRIALFDHLLVSGEGLRRRFIDEGLAAADAIEAVGSIKLAELLSRPASAVPDFAEARPIVLYNPHFERALSSWPIARAIVAGVLATGAFNLIVAPHVRLAERLSAEERGWFERSRARGDVHVDFGSAASFDMTYTRAADIYLGDVSSQVYEFLYHPRPVVFADAHGADWRDNPDYRMWRAGEVAADAGAVVAALLRARARHGDFVETQRALAAAALGATDAAVAERAADAVLRVVGRDNRE